MKPEKFQSSKASTRWRLTHVHRKSNDWFLHETQAGLKCVKCQFVYKQKRKHSRLPAELPLRNAAFIISRTFHIHLHGNIFLDKPFQFRAAFHIETIHLICFVKLMAGLYMKCHRINWFIQRKNKCQTINDFNPK